MYEKEGTCIIIYAEKQWFVDGSSICTGLKQAPMSFFACYQAKVAIIIGTSEKSMNMYVPGFPCIMSASNVIFLAAKNLMTSGGVCVCLLRICLIIYLWIRARGTLIWEKGLSDQSQLATSLHPFKLGHSTKPAYCFQILQRNANFLLELFMAQCKQCVPDRFYPKKWPGYKTSQWSVHQCTHG